MFYSNPVICVVKYCIDCMFEYNLPLLHLLLIYQILPILKIKIAFNVWSNQLVNLYFSVWLTKAALWFRFDSFLYFENNPHYVIFDHELWL